MRRPAGLAAVVLLLAAGCGGGSEPDPAAPAASGAGPTPPRVPPPAALAPPPSASQPPPSPAPPSRLPPASPPSPAPAAGGLVPGVTTPDPAARPYALGPTRRCLDGRGASIGRVTDDDDQLRALADLAQRTSVLVRLGEGEVGLAVERQQANAQLLLELLRSPGSPYRIEQRVNAVLLYRPTARRAAAVVRDCLRG